MLPVIFPPIAMAGGCTSGLLLIFRHENRKSVV
jgi:hypothetical protein